VQILCSAMQATTASVACKKHPLLSDMDKDILFLGLALEGVGVLTHVPQAALRPSQHLVPVWDRRGAPGEQVIQR
jgi:hypothetical protein